VPILTILQDVFAWLLSSYKVDTILQGMYAGRKKGDLRAVVRETGGGTACMCTSVYVTSVVNYE
jgi:hypothetical protein